MADETLIVLQARVGSSRLPGKALASIAGASLLSHCVRRLVAADAGRLVIATTTLPEDDVLAAEAERLGAAVVRGPVDDVLGRFILAIQDWDGAFVIRATADNPAMDIGAPARVLRVLETGADYVAETGLPLGSAVEGVRVPALRLASTEATSPDDREHVTAYIRGQPRRFDVRLPQAPPGLRRPDLRFSVDTAADLAYMRRVLDQAGAAGRVVPLSAIIAAASAVR